MWGQQHRTLQLPPFLYRFYAGASLICRHPPHLKVSPQHKWAWTFLTYVEFTTTNESQNHNPVHKEFSRENFKLETRDSRTKGAFLCWHYILAPKLLPQKGNLGEMFLCHQISQTVLGKVEWINECCCAVIRQKENQTEFGTDWIEMWHHMGPGIRIPTFEINGIASRVNFAPKHLEKVGCTNLKCV